MKSVPKLYDIRSFGILAFRIRWTDFCNLYIVWKRFGCRWSIWTFFFDIQGHCHGNQFWQNVQNDLHSAPWHYKTRCTIVLQINAFIATLIALHRVKNGENWFSSFWVKPGYKMKIVLRLDRNWPISPNISRTTEPVITYVSALIDVYMRIIKPT